MDDGAAAPADASAATPGPPTGLPGEGAAPSWRRMVLLAVVGLVVMAGVFLLLLPQVSSYEQAVAELGDIPTGWLVALVVAGVVNIVVYPCTVLVAVPGLSYRHGFVERQVGFLVSNVVPGGGAVAVGTQYTVLSRYRVGHAAAAAAVSADAVWTYLLTLGFPALAVALLVVEGRSTAGYTTIAAIGLAAVVVSVLAIVVILRSDVGATRVGRLGERLTRPVMTRLGRPVPDLVTALVTFRGQAAGLVAQRWGRLTVTNLAAQLTPLVVLFCALGGLGTVPDPLSPIEVFAAYSIALLLTSFPITPGGLGTVDAALVALLTAFGASGSEAVAADLLWRLVWFLPQLLAGVIAFVGYSIGRRRSRASVVG